MPDDSRDDRSEICFLALTRPPLIHGVPYEAAIINAICCFWAGFFLSGDTLLTCPLLFWAAGIPIHTGLKRLTAYDFHAFRQIRLRLQSGQVIMDGHRIEKPKFARDIPSSV